MATIPGGQSKDHIAAELEVVEAREHLADAYERLAKTEDQLGDKAAANRHRHDAAHELAQAKDEVDEIIHEMEHEPAQGDPAKNGSRTGSPKTWPRT